ncbi:MAG: histidinol-phosphate aminotransferase family protein [Bryobacteraceae bacterium]|nr:histidinol-phosphate aminotransferase family protein [Bryobacteraceae bacterium]MCX7603549.1 histidinol-phosphate aminotransferase family protein [Bryobacteraceae bacterium]
MLRPRRAILEMAPYSPPSSGREGKIRLDFNENTLGCSPRVLAFLREKLSEERLSIYPEYEETRRALGRYFSLPESHFTICNGTDEAIQVLVHTYVGEGDRVLVLHPSYAMYRFYAQVAGARVAEIPYRPGDLAFPLEELLAAIGPDVRAILVSNPNNPTGSAIGLAEIVRILEAAPAAAVLIDEAYYDFYGVTALGLIEKFPNLFVSRTFSKAHGLAALRVGVLFSREENVAFLRKGQSPYSVNALAALAVRAAVEDREYLENYVRQALAARGLLYEGFRRRGIRYWPSQGNFVLFEAGARAIEIRDALRARGVLVRDRSYELPGTVRVTAGTPAQVARFFDALDEVWP